MKILLTGSLGMLGLALQKTFSDCTICAYSRKQLDVCDEEMVNLTISKIKPNFVIHAAAYTDVDGCEKNRELAYQVNIMGSKFISKTCEKYKAILIAFSSDYVFDGEKKSPYLEIDLPNPINVYGDSKLKGEKEIQNHLNNAYILRTSWLFGPGGKNFVDTIIARAKTNEPLKVVNDQIGSPTFTQHLATAVRELILKLPPFGIYHVTASESCSWFDFAQLILKSKASVAPIRSSEINRPAKRPMNSRLSNEKWQKAELTPLPSFELGLAEYLKIY